MRLAVLFAYLLACTPAWADSAVVFMYHRFGEQQHPATNVRMEDFRAQLELLSKPPFTVVPLQQVLDHLATGTPLPDHAVAITVDDAYRTVHEQAWPLLREHGLPLTVFVATDPVDRGYTDMMDWAQMRELAAAGVTFANHGASHDYLVRRRAGEDEAAWRGRVAADIRSGQARLAAELGETGAVLDGVFAYPYGEYDRAIADILVEQGYLAFGQQSGAIGAGSDRLALPRFPINENHSDLAEFRTKAASLPLPVARIEPWDPVGGPRPVLDLWFEPALERHAALTCYIGGQGRQPPEWIEPGKQARIAPAQPLPRGRSRVNCTLPGPGGRWFWYSHQWLVP